jgi:hypothetical protein
MRTLRWTKVDTTRIGHRSDAGDLDLGEAGSVQKLVDAATARFGHFDSACIRTGAHKTGTILEATAEDAHFVATLIDGKGTGQIAQFFAIDGGWSFV